MPASSRCPDAQLCVSGGPSTVHPQASPGPIWDAHPGRLSGSHRQLHESLGLIRLSSLPSLLVDPVTGRKPSPKSIWRWAVKGHHGTKLKTVRMPYGRCTTQEYLDEFLAGLSGKPNLVPCLPSLPAHGPACSQQIAREAAMRIVGGRNARGGVQ